MSREQLARDLWDACHVLGAQEWNALADFVLADRQATASRVREACAAKCDAVAVDELDSDETRWSSLCARDIRALDLAAILEAP